MSDIAGMGQHMENVFIAWSGNYELATCVAAQLEKRGFHAIVGGGAPHDMYIGVQVQTQMNACAYAVILAQKKPDIADHAEFSDNVMFEWGYMISRLPSKNVFVFLIDTGERELPSDLIGSWIIPVERGEADNEELSLDIANQFEIEIQSLDKLEILSRWKEMKSAIKRHEARRRYSDYEMAQFSLFSLKSAYYHDEMPSFYQALSNMSTATGTLGAVIELTQAIASIFINTANLARPLEIEDYFELTTALSQPFEDRVEENDLRQWAQILRYDAISLCNIMVASGESEDERAFYYEESLTWGRKTLEAIEANIAENPENEFFADLMKSYQYRNQAKAYHELGKVDEAKECLTLAVKNRERFYFQYRRAYPEDSVLRSKLSQEYYLSLLESAKYEDNPLERRKIVATVKKLMGSWKEDFERQQALFEMVRKAYDALTV